MSHPIDFHNSLAPSVPKLCVCVMEYYLAIKKNGIMPLATTQMDLEFIILSEVSQKEKDQYHMVSLNTWSLKYGTNELIYRPETDSQT